MTLFSVPALLASALYGPVAWPRAAALVRRIGPHLTGPEVLDLGAGSGHTSALLAQRPGLRVTMADVPPHAGAWGQKLIAQPIASRLSQRHSLERVCYDGQTLPFPAGRFDTVLLAFVLHHCPDPARVLGEAVRVARRRVLVLEDTGPQPSWADAVLNLEWGHPHQERTPAQWHTLFEQAGLHLHAEEHWTSGRWLHHTLFVLNRTENTPAQAAASGGGGRTEVTGSGR